MTVLQILLKQFVSRYNDLETKGASEDVVNELKIVSAYVEGCMDLEEKQLRDAWRDGFNSSCDVSKFYIKNLKDAQQ